MNKVDLDDIAEWIGEARRAGLEGFAGKCLSAAVALNRVIFEGQAEFVVAANRAFLEHGHFFGHVALRANGIHWDADGRPKPLEDIESWGMLDADDPDYQELAADLGFAWHVGAAEDVQIDTYLSEQDFLDAFPEVSAEQIHLAESFLEATSPFTY